MRRLHLGIGATFVLIVVTALAPPAVRAAPTWNLDVHHYPTVVPPGGSAEFRLDIRNEGSHSSLGQTTVIIQLPPGLTRVATLNEADLAATPGPATWSCPGSPGDVTVVCTTSSPIGRHSLSRSLTVLAFASTEAKGEPTATAELSGGGASTSASAVEPIPVGTDPASFGLVPDSFRPDFLAADGVASVRDAGGHPSMLRVPLDFNTVAAPTADSPRRKALPETLRDLEVDLPPGFVGLLGAVEECPPFLFTIYACPPASQVGRLDASIYPLSSGVASSFTTGVFNLPHPRGAVGDFAFTMLGNPVHVRTELDPARDYALRATISDVNESIPAFDQTLTVWGVPAGPSHDSERCVAFSLEFGSTGEECAAGVEPEPFLVLPSRCGARLGLTVSRYDSWQSPGTSGPPLGYTMEGTVGPCEQPPPKPSLTVQATATAAASPTGLEFEVALPFQEELDLSATPPLERISVKMPPGLTVSAAAADSLTACSPNGIGLGTNRPVGCPDASRIGTATVSTPLLPQPLKGSIYLATQGDNPFGALLAVYVVVHDEEERGVLLKLPGRLDLDPRSGEITAVFDDLPELPFDRLSFAFRGGPKAPFVNPAACGPATVRLRASSVADPAQPLEAIAGFEVGEGPAGHPCVDPAAAPFSPRFEAGSLSSKAGAWAPFVLRVARGESEQPLGAVEATLPPGVAAKLAGVSRCRSASITSVPTEPGSGRSDFGAAACPSGSRVGDVLVEAGAGPEPIRLQGSLYLSGPYAGAPLSLAAAVPAVAGPLDLGNVVVRLAVHVDPATGQLRVVSDRLPSILAGVPLDLRELRVRLDRKRFMRNPTSCDATVVRAAATSALAARASLANRFQVGGCGRLGFRPRIGLRFGHAVGRNGHPRILIRVRPRPGDADLRAAAILFPRGEHLDQGHLRDVCTRADFRAQSCPDASAYGRVSAWSPLLARPLRGRLYLREGERRLPDLAARLEGEAPIVLSGHLGVRRARLRASIDRFPGVPLSRVELVLAGGRRGLLVNSDGLCGSSLRAPASFVATSGKQSWAEPRLEAECG